MTLATMAEDRLNEVGRRIDVLHATTQAAQPRRGTPRWVTALRTREASVRAAVHEATASIEEHVLQLETRVSIAEHGAAADVAEDVDEFLRSMTDELHSWDVYLERLQVKIATTAGSGREQSERALGELRRYRNTLDAHARGVLSTSGSSWRDVRKRVQAARDELGSHALAVEATLVDGSGGMHARVSVGRGA